MTVSISGLGVGHWTDTEARTGCTVVVLPEGTMASGEVRGGAPATREFALLDPSRTVSAVDAVVLSGGSAFGLAAVDGVMAELEAAGRGFPTRFGRVPIVVGMSLYDLGVGDPSVRPRSEQGRSACREALASPGGTISGGPVGAGCGATVGKWGGSAADGGLGVATVTGVGRGDQGDVDVVVTAIVAVNAFGFVDDGTLGDDPGPQQLPSFGPAADDGGGELTNTTIGVIVTNARLSKTDCLLLAHSGHDGLARSLLPAHTAVDGDALVAAATGAVDAEMMGLRALAQTAVIRAVRSVGATTL